MSDAIAALAKNLSPDVYVRASHTLRKSTKMAYFASKFKSQNASEFQ
jgi:hypothetical protein